MLIAKRTTAADSTFKWEHACPIKLSFNSKRLYETKILIRNKFSKQWLSKQEELYKVMKGQGVN